MKYLFIVQGDGRGHMTQAIALSDILRRNGHEVVEVLAGKSKGREIPCFFYEKIGSKVKTFDTPSLILKKNKKNIHALKSLIYNIHPKRIRKYLKSIGFIHHQIKKNEPDVVVNFFEVLTGFTRLRYHFDIPFISIGHQYLLKHPDYTFGRGNEEGMMFLRLYTFLCGLGSTKTLALSFYPMKNTFDEKLIVVPPLLRKEVLQLKPVKGEYILGYMLNPGYKDEIAAWHKKNPDTKLHLFWDKKDAEKEYKVDKTMMIHTLNDEKFLQYMAGCKGYITTAGFESVCEAMYLNKPIMMIPVHMEQEVNAADAASVGGGIIGDSFDVNLLLDYIDTKPSSDQSFVQWTSSAEEIFLKYLTSSHKEIHKNVYLSLEG